jgi:hypothetical protein
VWQITAGICFLEVSVIGSPTVDIVRSRSCLVLNPTTQERRRHSLAQFSAHLRLREAKFDRIISYSFNIPAALQIAVLITTARSKVVSPMIGFEVRRKESEGGA